MANQAFVDVGDNYKLCIGTKAEVDEATPAKLVEMIYVALAWSQFRSERNLTVH